MRPNVYCLQVVRARSSTGTLTRPPQSPPPASKNEVEVAIAVLEVDMYKIMTEYTLYDT